MPRSRLAAARAAGGGADGAGRRAVARGAGQAVRRPPARGRREPGVASSPPGSSARSRRRGRRWRSSTGRRCGSSGRSPGRWPAELFRRALTASAGAARHVIEASRMAAIMWPSHICHGRHGRPRTSYCFERRNLPPVADRRRLPPNPLPIWPPARSASSTASCPGCISTAACWKRPRTPTIRCSSGCGSSRSRPTTSTNSSWCASPASRARCAPASPTSSPDGLTPAEQLARIGEAVSQPRQRPAGALARAARRSSRAGTSCWSTADEPARRPNAPGSRIISCDTSSRC